MAHSCMRTAWLFAELLFIADLLHDVDFLRDGLVMSTSFFIICI